MFSRELCDYLCFTRFDAAWSKEIFTAAHLLDTESIEVIVLTFYPREVYFKSVFICTYVQPMSWAIVRDG